MKQLHHGQFWTWRAQLLTIFGLHAADQGRKNTEEFLSAFGRVAVSATEVNDADATASAAVAKWGDAYG